MDLHSSTTEDAQEPPRLYPVLVGGLRPHITYPSPVADPGVCEKGGLVS